MAAEIIKPLLIWAAAWSVINFLVCGWDKLCAKKGFRRVRERTLWLLTVIGGAAGMLIGMQLFRHKTKHRSFVWGVPAVVLVQIALIIWLGLR